MGDDREEHSSRARRDALRAGRGLLSVLLGTALLGVLGFALGIVGGLVLEEPSLLLDYVTGRTTTARLADEPAPAAAVATPMDVAAAPPAFVPVESEPVAPFAPEPPTAPGTAEEVAPAPVEAAPPVETPEAAALEPEDASPEPAEAPTPAHAGQSGYAVQVGALADSASAERLAAKLTKRGFTVYIAPSAESSARRWRVRVGPVATREDAQRLAARLEREKLPTWVLAEARR